MKNLYIYINILAISLVGCQSKTPIFNGDNAFKHLVKQCSFGPRDPGSVGHRNTLNYYLETFKGLADTVFTQSFEDVMPRTGAKVMMSNVIAQFNPAASKQIMLSAHWDTRPYADRDLEKKNFYKPILGANDGASGVAILLELAKLLNKNKPTIGVNLVFFDAEDSGVSEENESYCKGSIFFAKNLPIPNIKEAIILDMVLSLIHI